MILLLCFLTAFGLGRCLDQLQTREEIETSINRTITEVERLIKIDPSLPQLSRAEIVDILHNITSKDMDSFEKSVENTRSDYQRALTVVLPYNSRDAKNEDIQNLFTKPPMIQVIPDSETMLPYSSIQEEPPVSSDPIIDNLISTKYPDEKKNQFSNNKNKYKNHRTTYDEPAKVDSSLRKFNSNFNNFNSQKAIWPTTSSISKLINSDQNDNSTAKPKLQIIYSTSVTDKPTTKMFKTTTLRTNNEFRPTMPATKSTVNILTSDQWKYFAPPSTTASTTTTSTTTSTTTTTTTTTTTKKPPTTTRKSPQITTKYSRPSPFHQKSQPFLPTVISTSSHQWPTHPPRQPLKKRPETSSKAPDMLTFDMSDVKMMNDESTPMLFVTPLSTKGPEKISKPSSTVASNKVDQPQTVSMTPMPVRKEVATLLASIGLQPSEKKIVKEKILNNEINLVKEQGIFATNFEIPVINNTLSHETHQSSIDKVNSSLIINQTTFNNAQKGVDNLSSDIQKLFQRFGLQTSKNDATSTTTKAPIPFKTNSWSNFKPLPKSEVKDATMKDFLASFGLGVDNRNAKTVKMSKGRSSSVIEAVPSAMKSILENIGLIMRPKVPRHVQLKTTTSTTSTTTTSTTEDPEKMHVFKPHEVLFGDPQQRIKINELLDTVKLVQEGEADVSDVRKVADDLLKNTKTLQDGPNPLNLDELFRLYNDDIKNEVKRQESKANLSNDTSATNNSDPSESLLTEMIETTGDNTSRNSSDSLPESSISLDMSDDNTDARVVTSGVIATTSTEATTASSTTTESSPSTEDSNLDALAESFGGNTAEPDPVLPTPRKSGLYFLVDWNSFLEVGVDGEDKVNLKFAPKVGDRTRFIPVTVP